MDNEPGTATSPTRTGQIVIPCDDLALAITLLTDHLGFRLDMIMPADAPRIATVSGHGVVLRLEAPNRPTEAGRAGMHYRDLIPGRMGGRFIASLIRIPEGGPVPDYVHYHQVRFQLIYCRRGWVRVVYEDQGPPFVMQAGDCVLQPPTIRHRVLEASPGLEVIEIGGPAEHETWREHLVELPTTLLRPERDFGGQRFVRHAAATASWLSDPERGFDYRDLGIANATCGQVGARVLRAAAGVQPPVRAASTTRAGEFHFLFSLDGGFRVHGTAFESHTFKADEAWVVPAGADFVLDLPIGAEVLEVSLPAHGCPAEVAMRM